MSARDLAVIQPPDQRSPYRQYRFTLRRNSKKSWAELQWRHSEGRVTLRMPTSCSLKDCLTEFDRCTPWFDRFCQRHQKARMIRIDDSPHTLSSSSQHGRKAVIGDGKITLPYAPAAQVSRALVTAISDLTLRAMRQHVADKATLLGMTPGRIRLSSAQRKWGACDPKNNLNFSWRLAMAPDFVQEYLAAHEVAHFKHKHHQPSFWDTVDDLMPGWPQAEQWLAFCGPTLMTTDVGAIAAQGRPAPTPGATPQPHRVLFSPQ